MVESSSPCSGELIFGIKMSVHKRHHSIMGRGSINLWSMNVYSLKNDERGWECQKLDNIVWRHLWTIPNENLWSNGRVKSPFLERKQISITFVANFPFRKYQQLCPSLFAFCQQNKTKQKDFFNRCSFMWLHTNYEQTTCDDNNRMITITVDFYIVIFSTWTF